MATTLTPTRLAVLRVAAAGNMVKVWPIHAAAKPYFADRGTMPANRLNKAPVDWAFAQRLIRLDAPSLRGTPVVLTPAGLEALAAADALASERE